MGPILVSPVLMVIAGLGAAGSPVIVTMMAGRQRRMERREDWDRQDKVAKQLKEDTENARLAALKASRKVDEGIGVSLQNNDLLKTVHALVNNDMTIAIQHDLLETRDTLAALIELQALGGRDVSEAISIKRSKIEQLERALAERAEQAKAIQDTGDSEVRLTSVDQKGR